MSESLIVKDGTGTLRNLQVDSGSNGYISNHTLVSTVTGSRVASYYPGGGLDGSWDWGGTNFSSSFPYDKERKGFIINNNSEDGKCYVLVGSGDFGTNNPGSAPQKYSFMLDGGAVYLGDSATSALEHHFCVVSSSILTDASSITVTVTEIY